MADRELKTLISAESTQMNPNVRKIITNKRLNFLKKSDGQRCSKKISFTGIRIFYEFRAKKMEQNLINRNHVLLF
jgi:hypothetical protein